MPLLIIHIRNNSISSLLWYPDFNNSLTHKDLQSINSINYSLFLTPSESLLVLHLMNNHYNLTPAYTINSLILFLLYCACMAKHLSRVNLILHLLTSYTQRKLKLHFIMNSRHLLMRIGNCIKVL